MTTPFISESTFKGATKEAAVPASKNNTDVIAPEFKLYIEGVQVPYEAITISQTYQGKPTAQLQIPAQTGFLDICRGYQPKVHVFFRDENYGGDRLLFWGHILGASYGRDRASGSSYVTLSCEHKNMVLSQLTLDYTGWASPMNSSLTDPSAETGGAGVKPGAFNSQAMVINALSGVDGVSTEAERISLSNKNLANAPTNKLDITLKNLEPRLKGMPGVIVNLWNQLKKNAYRFPKDNFLLNKMYTPLFDEGVSFFKRMSGHPLVEDKLQDTKESYCNKFTGEEIKVLIPPYCRTSITSAIASEMAAKHIMSAIGFSGELTSFERLMQDFYASSEYDILTLASPAEIATDPTKFIDGDLNKDGVDKVTVETIIKPQIPFYFSPTCNVLLPKMFSRLQINQDESSVPTRVSAHHDAMPRSEGPSSLGTSFKGPASFREAVAYTSMLKNVNGVARLDLSATKGNSFSVPAKYEQGSGVRHSRIALPWWLAVLASDRSNQGPAPNQEAVAARDTQQYKNMILASAEWKARYGQNTSEVDGRFRTAVNHSKNGLNPYDINNKSVLPHERIMFSSIDYEYSKRVAGSKTGFIEAIFNPYIIPGYPMDVIDEGPNYSSFHGFCTSVTHTITSRTVSTTVSMVAAVSYAELSNYYIPPTAPFLQTALEMLNGEINEAELSTSELGSTDPVKSTSATLLQNPKAKAAADTFYRQVLGVGSAAPDDLVHFASNISLPLTRKAGILIPSKTMSSNEAPLKKVLDHAAREKDDYNSVVGNLRLVSRPIESKESISKKFKYNFIDLTPAMYNDNLVSYINPKLASSLYLEPGASLFLEYQETQDFLGK